MSIENWPGGVISKTPPTPSGPYQDSTAPGVWTLRQATDYIKQGIWPTAGNVNADPYFEYVTMLLHGDGTNGGQNNTFLDSSTNNFTVTRNGNTTQGSFSPYGTLWSNYFDGTGDYLSLSVGSQLNFGTGDFTMEAWVYVTNFVSDANSIAASAGPTNGGWMWAIRSSTDVAFGRNLVAWDADTSGVTLSVNTWYHVAVCRASGTLRIFVNGTSYFSGSNSTSYTIPDSNFAVGARQASSGSLGYAEFFNGYISNLRIVNGTALYTSNFTPSTTPLTAVSNTRLLTCADSRFIDDSTNNFSITRNGDTSVQRFSPFSPTAEYSTATIGGSGYFDGTNDYLTVADNTALRLGAGDFCVEAYVYLPSSGVYLIYEKGFGNAGGMGFWVQDTLRIRLYDGSANQTTVTSSVNVPRNAWSHIAATRSGTTVKLFINGAEVGSSSIAYDVNNTGTLGVGAYANGSGPTLGYISSARIVKGSAVYTSAFTPPSSPLTAITNTSLLLNFTNGAIFDNAMMNDLETVGNAQISTSVKKFGTGSLAFDGTGDWLQSAYTPNIDLGSGNFTVECWVYPSSSATQAVFSICGSTSSSFAQLQVAIDSSNTWYLLASTSLDTWISSSTAGSYSPNNWHHVAVVRNGNTLTLYVNGTSVLTQTASGALYAYGGSTRIGANATGGINFGGYVDDLRITKGIARYTANFTPPTAAFQNF